MAQKVGDKNASPDKKKKGMDIFVYLFKKRHICMFITRLFIYLLKSTLISDIYVVSLRVIFFIFLCVCMLIIFV